MNGFIRGRREGEREQDRGSRREAKDGWNLRTSLAFNWGPNFGPTKGEGRQTIHACPPEEGRKEGRIHNLGLGEISPREKCIFSPSLARRSRRRPAERPRWTDERAQLAAN